jgi:CubicO group peptidase (beta-lactamase class C family)
MHTRRSLLLGAAASITSLSVIAASANQPWGTWTGVLNLGSTRLRLRFELASDGGATLYSVDQGNTPIPGKVVFGKGGKVRVDFAAIDATYNGQLGSDDRLEGVWRQTSEIRLTLLRGEAGLDDPVRPLTQPALALLLRQCGAPALGVVANRRADLTNIWLAGRRSVFGGARVASTDKWHIGSITKSMTSTLVARLVEAGIVGWDLRVGSVLAGVAPDMRPEYRAATLRHLLSHRAGLAADLPGPLLLTFQLGDAMEIGSQRRRYSRQALAMEPVGPLEATYQYSNCGYVIAATMLETLLGRSWEELMREHLFQPLGLKSAGFGPPDPGAFGPPREPLGHAADLDAKLLRVLGGGGIRPMRPGIGEIADNPRVIGPAGRVHINLEDFAVYLNAHRDRTAFLSRDSWRTLHTPPYGGDYALGWVVRPDGALWHNGSNTFWYAEAMIDFRTGISIASVCNESREAAMLAVGSALLRAAASF